MEMTGNEIRELFLKYFEVNGHTRVPSSPLLPVNDPTLLFANAGMNQFKDVFTGAEKRSYTRAVSSQKCIRAGGKHNDLDDVGKTARHQTFFEMLGNFSFGDYFKREAIRFAWELLLDVYKLPLERLWVSVYEQDDEAAQLWIEQGLSPERIVRLGAQDNFWQMGDTGPCGPCSEIHYYRGENPEDPAQNRVGLVGTDMTLEFYNLVFMQFERAADGTLTPLPAPSVDTGLGFERLAAILQNATTNYDTDLLKPLVDYAGELSGIGYEYESQAGFAMRVIADHARCTAFAIADGIIPGNEGRNYVLRKIMRRAIYQGHHALKLDGEFFYKVTDKVIKMMRGAYPELETSRAVIEKIVRAEERRFGSTLTVGLGKLDEMFASRAAVGGTSQENESAVDYKELARLYDTFGTPRDLIRVGLEERGFDIPEDDFMREFDVALAELQASGGSVKATQTAKGNPVYQRVFERDGVVEFLGYTTTSAEACEVVALIKDGAEVESLNAGEAGEVILNRTPFYAEAGGQVGDTGHLVSSDAEAGESVFVIVENTFAPVRGLNTHQVKVERGMLRMGTKLNAFVDASRRDAIRRNHTATHLLHAALRDVLGTHVKQAGSLVAPNRLRFDFAHFQSLSAEELEQIETLVNENVLKNTGVETNVMPVDEAMKSGAMALFGEKYGDKVRVVSLGEFSKELCGGTHVRASGDIGAFKLIRDEAVASGVRRVEAITGADAYKRFSEDEEMLNQLAAQLRTTREALPQVVERLQEELKRTRKETEELRLKLATGVSSGGANDVEAREVKGIKILAREASELDANALRQLSDTLLARLKSGIVILGRKGEGKASLIVRVSPDLQNRIKAGDIIKHLAPIIGGKGGGRADMAEGGGSDVDKLGDALKESYAVVERILS
ncbi:MAG: alanine--tRNA ligase [Pyrinomonadaceae bacterium MAG19_C2-C3]|nr:alanine--tRNA ligase [Pyrinomonadaceae bacterium MAG19_C2-C3]